MLFSYLQIEKKEPVTTSNRMTKNFCLYILFGFCLQACMGDQLAAPALQWHEVALADQGSVYSLYGSLEGDLLMGTDEGIVKLADMGRRWTMIKKTNSPITNFVWKHDTLYALSGSDKYYSINHGEIWTQTTRNIVPFEKALVDSKGVLYRGENMLISQSPSPSRILRSLDEGQSWENIFNDQKFVYDLLLDGHNRLYIGTNNWEWSESAGAFRVKDNTAVLYYLEN